VLPKSSACSWSRKWREEQRRLQLRKQEAPSMA